MAGIVFLAAVARGYFDQAADIGIALFTRPAATTTLPSRFLKLEGLAEPREMNVRSAYERERARWRACTMPLPER